MDKIPDWLQWLLQLRLVQRRYTLCSDILTGMLTFYIKVLTKVSMTENYQVGFRHGKCFDNYRLAWDGDGMRPLAWSAWYPCLAGDNSVCLYSRWFKSETVLPDAKLAPSTSPRPLVLLSHGSGASAMALSWLAHRLACQGIVALAINHHGHTGEEERYRAEGFLCLWERASDISALLNETNWREMIGGKIADRAKIIGFSAGAHTALLMIGAKINYSQFEPDNPRKALCADHVNSQIWRMNSQNCCDHQKFLDNLGRKDGVISAMTKFRAPWPSHLAGRCWVSQKNP